MYKFILSFITILLMTTMSFGEGKVTELLMENGESKEFKADHPSFEYLYVIVRTPDRHHSKRRRMEQVQNIRTNTHLHSIILKLQHNHIVLSTIRYSDTNLGRHRTRQGYHHKFKH